MCTFYYHHKMSNKIAISIKSVSGSGMLICHLWNPNRFWFVYLLTLVLYSAFSLEVDSSKTIGHIKSLLIQQDPSIHPDSAAIIYAGKTLDDSKTLQDYMITNDSTLHYSSGNQKKTESGSSSTNPSASSQTHSASRSSSSTSLTSLTSQPTTITKPAAAKRNKKRCSAKNCISAPLRYVGDCQFCNGRFCSKHRLLEQHDCINLQNCKQQLYEYVFNIFLFISFYPLCHMSKSAFTWKQYPNKQDTLVMLLFDTFLFLFWLKLFLFCLFGTFYAAHVHTSAHSLKDFFLFFATIHLHLFCRLGLFLFFTFYLYGNVVWCKYEKSLEQQ